MKYKPVKCRIRVLRHGSPIGVKSTNVLAIVHEDVAFATWRNLVFHRSVMGIMFSSGEKIMKYKPVKDKTYGHTRTVAHYQNIEVPFVVPFRTYRADSPKEEASRSLSRVVFWNLEHFIKVRQFICVSLGFSDFLVWNDHLHVIEKGGVQ